jgi:hypothetical protein
MIKNGSVIESDEILNNCIGTPFKNQAQLLYNAAYIGFNSKLNVATGVPNLKNIKYDAMLTDTATTKTAIAYNSTDKLYFSWPFTPSKGDSIADSTAEVTHNSSSYTLKKTISSIDDYVFSTELQVAELGVSYGWYKIIITYSDATTAETTDNYFSGAYSTKIYENPNPQKMVSKIDYYLKSFSTNVTYMRNVYVYECPANETNPTLIFQTTSLPTITDCIPTWNSLIDSENTLTVSISADGTNYEEVTDSTIHRFTNTGTNLYIKFEIDRVDTAAVDKISEYAVLMNCTGA